MTNTQPSGAESALDLLPCPFCGGREASVCERDHLHFVMCDNCTAEGPAMEGVQSRLDAAKEWNRRATSPRAGQAPAPQAMLACELAPTTGVYTVDQVKEMLAAQPVEAGSAVQAEPFMWVNPEQVQRARLTDYAESVEASGASVKFGHFTMPLYAHPAEPVGDITADEARAALLAMPIEEVSKMVVGGALVATAEPVYQRQEAEGAWRDTTLLGHQAWADSGRATRLVYLAPESAAAPADHPTPCRNRLIESGAQAIPKSCPRCGLNKYCADTALPQLTMPTTQGEKA